MWGIDRLLTQFSLPKWVYCKKHVPCETRYLARCVYDKVPQSVLTSFDIFEKEVGGVNEREIFLWICLL